MIGSVYWSETYKENWLSQDTVQKDVPMLNKCWNKDFENFVLVSHPADFKVRTNPYNSGWARRHRYHRQSTCSNSDHPPSHFQKAHNSCPIDCGAIEDCMRTYVWTVNTHEKLKPHALQVAEISQTHATEKGKSTVGRSLATIKVTVSRINCTDVILCQ